MTSNLPFEITAGSSYRERVVPSAWVWLMAAAFCFALGLSYAAPFGTPVGAVTALAAAALVTVGLFAWSPLIEVRHGELHAGRAHIDTLWLTRIAPLTADKAAELRGRDADPMAWMLLRGWVSTAVRIDLDDPDDPTPYWYVSTRHPEALASAIEHARDERRYGRMSS